MQEKRHEWVLEEHRCEIWIDNSEIGIMMPCNER